MHLISEISTELTRSVSVDGLSITVRALIASVVTIVLVSGVLALPFPGGDGAIASRRRSKAAAGDDEFAVPAASGRPTP